MEETTKDTAPLQFHLRISRSALKFIIAVMAVTLAVLVLVLCAANPLRTLLEQHDAAQPENVVADVYELLFADPDWGLLYDISGVKATEYEGKQEYVSYMESKVGDASLTCTETPAGLSGLRRYSIRLGSEEIASFTLQSVDDGVSTFPRWELDAVEVYFTRTQEVRIRIMPECTVYINGTKLSDEHITCQVVTAAEDYLPEGVHGYRHTDLYLDGLLIQPNIVVLDARGNPMSVTYDEALGLYTVPIANTEPITEEERQIILAAAQAELLFSIRANSLSQLRQHFDANSSAYTQIVNSDPVMKAWSSYEFDETVTSVTDFYQYSDKLFSAQVTLRLNVTDHDGNVHPLDMTTTYFFTVNNAGNILVTDRLDVDLQQIIHIYSAEG